MCGKIVLFLCAAGIASASQFSTTPAPEYLPAALPTSGYSYSVPYKPLELPSKTYSIYSAPVYPKITPTITSYSETPVVNSISYVESKPIVAKPVIPAVSYQTVTAAPIVYSTPAPVVAKTVSYQAPVVAKSYSVPTATFAPFVAQPAVSVAAAPVYTKSYVQPVQSFVSAPVVKSYVQPSVTYASAPVVSKSYVQPAVQSFVSAPVVKAYQPAVSYEAAPFVKSYVQPAVSYASAPVVNTFAQSYVQPVSYASAPAVAQYVSPSASYFTNSESSVAYSAPSYSYASGPLVNSAVAYPSAPEVSFVSYKKKK